MTEWLSPAASAAPDGSSGSSGAAPALELGPVDRPLVVDLDGTLIRGNVLLESLVACARQSPLALLRTPLWLLRGRACLKRELASRASLAAASLPVNGDFLNFIRAERERGRRVYLATAADRSIADAVAAAHPVFDGVLASDGVLNLKGRNKCEALEAMFPAGFAYAGDSRADLPIWRKTDEVIVVGGSYRTRRSALSLGRPTRTFPRTSRLLAFLEGARPHQWAKNTLVFVPAILGGALSSPEPMLATALSFVAICLVASGTYLLNDVWDVADDRRHWSKQRRPIASGALPIGWALVGAPSLIGAGLLLAATLGPGPFAVLTAYLALTCFYSFAGKRIPVLDVVLLAGLFTIRLVLGVSAAAVKPSPWLLVFSMFLFTSLCFAKRYVELERGAANGRRGISSRGYREQDAGLIVGLGLGAGIISILILVLYITFEAYTHTFYGNTLWLWAMPLSLFLWIARIWLLAGRGELNDDPVAFAVSDPVSLVLGLQMLAAFLMAWSGLFA